VTHEPDKLPDKLRGGRASEKRNKDSFLDINCPNVDFEVNLSWKLILSVLSHSFNRE